MDRPGCYTIPIDQPFLATLASGILARFGTNPLALAKLEILLPNRRSCRAFADILLQQSGQTSLLLPRIQAIGDVEEETFSPAISKPRLLLLYAEKVAAWFYKNGEVIPRSTAFAWAEKLSALQDECERYEVSLETLPKIFPEDLAAHRETLLSLLSMLAEENIQTQEQRRNELLKQKAETLRAISHPVIAAGSLGTIPATAHLLKTIAQLPQGYVVLPGLDRECGEVAKTHPQYGLQILLRTLNVEAKTIPDWVKSKNNTATKFCREWMQTPFRPQPLTPANNLTFIEADTDAMEVSAIAVAMRETLETPNKKAMLVTPDRRLGRQVSALLQQWDVEVNDSAGIPLSQTPLGSILTLIIDAASAPQSALLLLPLLKHPLCVFNRNEARELELKFFRKQRTPSGLFYENIQAALQPLSVLLKNSKRISLTELLIAHLQVLENFSGKPARPETPQLELALQELQQAAEGIFILASEYAALFHQLFARYQYRPAFGTHPRLTILSPMEARLMSADRVIIANLNDTAWPGKPSEDWLGKRARTQLGLPQHADAIGHAAHDFMQLLGTQEIILTRARYSEGTPQNPHPWLIRLRSIYQPATSPFLAWAKNNVVPQSPLTPPQPSPPLAARPTRLSATDIRDLIQQPYRYYARKILQLSPLELLSRESAEKDIGSALHRAFEAYVVSVPWPEPHKILVKLISDFMRPVLPHPAEWILWQPRIPLIAEQFLKWDEAERESFAQIFAELTGSAMMQVGNIELELHAKADRIALNDAGEAVIVDYKTGAIPKDRDIAIGKEPQLLIEKWVLEHNGYNIPLSLPHSPHCIGLRYWKINSNQARAEMTDAPEISADLLGQRIHSLLSLFYVKTGAFSAIPMDYRHNSDPYAHLARIEEAFFR